MSGGLLQLEYNTPYNFLSIKPEFTYFKRVYKRHTNFVMALAEVPVINYGFGKTSNIKLEPIGDLITSIILQITIPEILIGDTNTIKFAWVKILGLALIKYVRFYIGGQLIDSQYGEWMYIWLLLSINNTRNKEQAYAILFGNVDELITYNNNNKPEYNLQIPLLFWFNRLIYLSLPIIAIRYQDIILKICFNEFDKLIITNCPEAFIYNNCDYELVNFSLLINYVYLDLPERKLFAIENHSYLIDQVQTDKDYLYDKKSLIRLDYTLNCRDLIWMSRNPDYYSSKRFLCYTAETSWNSEILSFSYTLLEDSIIISEKELEFSINLWQEVPPETTMRTKNQKILIENLSLLYFYINTDSLILGKTSITGKIKANIIITECNQIKILDVTTKISLFDISVPVEFYNDTRIDTHDVFINQFGNFGKLIDGSGNITEYGSLYCDSYDIIKKHDSKFFNVLQPYYFYNVTIPTGINVYPFAIAPQEFQPSGEINFSEFKTSYLKLWNNIVYHECYNPEYELFVFTRNYNNLLINHGMIGLMV